MQENGNLLQRRIFDPGVWRLKRFCFQGGCKLQADDAAQHPTSCQATTNNLRSPEPEDANSN